MLLENATHLIQPLDIRIFSPLKNEMKKMVQLWSNRPENQGKTIGKYELIRVLFPALIKAFSNKSNIEQGFKKSGLFPWDPSQVDFSRMEASDVFTAAENLEDGSSMVLNDVPNLVENPSSDIPTAASSFTEASAHNQESELHSSANDGLTLTEVSAMSSPVGDPGIMPPASDQVSVSSGPPIPDTADHSALASDVLSITESREPSVVEPEASYNPVMQFSRNLPLEDRKRR